MTAFHGPLQVKNPESDTVHTEIGVSGSATFAEKATFTLEVIMSATSKQLGPIRAGRLHAGYSVLSQSATVAHNNSAGNPVIFELPPQSDIIDFYVDVTDSFDAGTLGTAGNLEVGVSGSTQMFANIPVSASTGVRLVASQQQLFSVTRKRWNRFANYVGNGRADGRIQVFVTARSQAATAMTKGEAYFTVVYAHRA